MGDSGRLFKRMRGVARRPGVRRYAGPIAARYFAIRNMRRDDEGRWRAGTAFEVAHWDDHWLADARSAGLLDPQQPLTDDFVIDAVDSLPPQSDPARILDVGAGPLTPLGKVHPRRQLDITACDALAEEYDAILTEAHVVPPVRTIYANGEHLIGSFRADRFDIVHCGNALDHHRDPLAGLEQMLAVAKPDGLVLLNHYEDEGVHQNYLGMHQWNITERNNRLVIWKPKHTYVIDDFLRGCAAVETTRSAPEHGRQRILSTISRLPALG